ncbi:alpha/beta hydrolase [Stagnimonas aquatica]|uniref:Alpha/beta hydrolase n=1 Tax=Stagnimonas aquatica TaxID=2689987 RepID=A0A3N0VH37_9GAMM|nr:alpha/beta hydrolase [Stagnimonas aquatica]ROH92077.1 alpha/beta hydrolase [Stagnimonas aquatica]
MNRRRRLVAALAALAICLLAGALLWTGYSLPARPQPAFEPTPAELEKLALFQQPESWFLGQLQGPREVADGQTLDPKLQYLAEQMRPVSQWLAPAMPLIFATPAGRRWVRNAIDREWQLYTKVTAPMRSVEDREIPGRDGPVAVRIYVPQAATTEPLPVLVYCHGGGWLFASVAALDRAVRLLANEARVIVISVDYRLAPEHPYPAASDDGEDAYRWALAHARTLGGDPDQVAVGGDSAGGHVAINTVQRQLAAGRPLPRALLLYYPGTGLPERSGSMQRFAVGYGLDASFIDFLLPRVFQGYTRPDQADALMDPLHKAPSLHGFPPTLVATGGFDILRDSGRAFAARLAADGVPVADLHYGPLTHSFLQFSGVVAEAERAATETARMLGQTLRDGALPAATTP